MLHRQIFLNWVSKWEHVKEQYKCIYIYIYIYIYSSHKIQMEIMMKKTALKCNKLKPNIISQTNPAESLRVNYLPVIAHDYMINVCKLII